MRIPDHPETYDILDETQRQHDTIATTATTYDILHVDGCGEWHTVSTTPTTCDATGETWIVMVDDDPIEKVLTTISDLTPPEGIDVLRQAIAVLTTRGLGRWGSVVIRTETTYRVRVDDEVVARGLWDRDDAERWIDLNLSADEARPRPDRRGPSPRSRGRPSRHD